MDRELIKELLKFINSPPDKEIRIMEVCGTHTQSVLKYGLPALLPSEIKMLSGPGCPVCVTPASYIDNAIELLNYNDIIIATFGDLVKIKGNIGSLQFHKDKKNKVIIIYSPLNLLEIAEKNKDKSIVFLAVGFETTAPVIASVIKLAQEKEIENLFFLTSLRLMPPVLHKILRQSNHNIDGIICPGHVASVMGADYFKFVGEVYSVPSVIAGFEETDILLAIYFIKKSLLRNTNIRLANLYKRTVQPSGNCSAQKLMHDVFEIRDGYWRDIGYIPSSALNIKNNYRRFDAAAKFELEDKDISESKQCPCGDVLIGKLKPYECMLFGSVCTPSNPQGSCMVSSEGACSINYRYGKGV